jgi:hypothetical protein
MTANDTVLFLLQKPTSIATLFLKQKPTIEMISLFLDCRELLTIAQILKVTWRRIADEKPIFQRAAILAHQPEFNVTRLEKITLLLIDDCCVKNDVYK